MTSARGETVDVERGGYYHCISRCVRRAFLCGYDEYSSRSYEHRKEWIRSRLSELLEVFAIDCIGYAVMSNHLHTVLHTRPEEAKRWSDEEVARRWRKLFPKRRDALGRPEAPSKSEIKVLTSQPEYIQECRKRLGDVSWFNRCMNENIARRANAEDKCSGRFWQGRFKCQRLEGSGAVLLCSVYVDLNPIRAGSATTPEESDYTSVQDRVRALRGVQRVDRPRLTRIDTVFPGLSEKRYLELVDQTGRVVVAGKGRISQDLLPILTRLGITERGLILNAKSQSRIFRRVVGPQQALRQLAARIGKCWLQGIGAAGRVFA